MATQRNATQGQGKEPTAALATPQKVVLGLKSSGGYYYKARQGTRRRMAWLGGAGRSEARQGMARFFQPLTIGKPMKPNEAGALRNTACLAMDHAEEQHTLARRHGLELGPWRQAMRDATVAKELADRWLVRV